MTITNAISAGTSEVNAHTTAEFMEHTKSMTVALQGTAAQISGNIRGLLTGQGMLMEAESNQETQRQLQGDRVAAARTYQYSTPLCQTATGAVQSVAMEVEALPDRIIRSRRNAGRSSGTGGGGSVAAQPKQDFEARKPDFCAKEDPACQGNDGNRPNADRMVFSILSLGNLGSDDDRKQAAWAVQNLTQPVVVPALTARDTEQPGGRERYLRRGAYETWLNLAKDTATDILVTRRDPTGSNQYYNSLAAEAGLPQVSGNVSLEDQDRMRESLRFGAGYHTRLANLNQPALLREIIGLLADKLQQDHRANQLREQSVLLQGATLSLLLEGKFETVRGSLN